MRGATRFVLPATLGVLVLLGPAAGAGESEAKQYNNALVRLNKRLHDAGGRFGDPVAPALQGVAVNLPEVRKAYQEIVKVLAEVKKAAAALKAPDSGSARTLARAYHRFLKGQEHLVGKHVGAFVRILEETNPPGAQGRARLTKILEDMSALETISLEEVRQAQRAFAEEHGFSLEPAQP